MPTNLACNQLERVKLYLINTSTESRIGSLKISSNGLTSSEICFAVPNNKPALDSGSLKNAKLIKSVNKNEFKFKESTLGSQTDDEASNNNKFAAKAPLETEFLYSLDGVTIEPNGCHELDMWIKAPEAEGEHKFCFMFFYQEILSPSHDDLGEGSRQIGKRKMSISQNLKFEIF